MLRTREWKYVHRYSDGPCELYDLVNDPDECVNRADDASQVERIGALRDQLEAWFARYVVPERDGRDAPVRGSGQLRPIGAKWKDDPRAAFAEK